MLKSNLVCCLLFMKKVNLLSVLLTFSFSLFPPPLSSQSLSLLHFPQWIFLRKSSLIKNLGLTGTFGHEEF